MSPQKNKTNPSKLNLRYPNIGCTENLVTGFHKEWRFVLSRNDNTSTTLVIIPSWRKNQKYVFFFFFSYDFIYTNVVVCEGPVYPGQMYIIVTLLHISPDLTLKRWCTYLQHLILKYWYIHSLYELVRSRGHNRILQTLVDTSGRNWRTIR